MHVLVIEDDEGDAVLATRHLTKEGFESTVAGTLKAALEALTNVALDAVLMDLHLPDSDGLAGVPAVVAHGLPVIVLTGSTDSLGTEAVQIGAQDFLPKSELSAPVLARSIRYACERHRLEQQRHDEAQRHAAAMDALVRQKTAILDHVAHDLNGPLSSINMAMFLLGLEDLSDDARENIATTRRAAARMERMTRELLDGARLQAGEAMALQEAPTDLLELAKGAINDVQSRANDRNITIRLTGAPAPMRLDVGRMERVFENLLSNAIKYGREGGSIHVLLERRKDRHRVEIQDDGRGLDPAMRNKLFTPFGQLHDPRELTVSSTGLGLYISKAVVVAHDGDMGAESKGLGHGSTFWIELPAPDSN